jgi:hypothetical protein
VWLLAENTVAQYRAISPPIKKIVSKNIPANEADIKSRWIGELMRRKVVITALVKWNTAPPAIKTKQARMIMNGPMMTEMQVICLFGTMSMMDFTTISMKRNGERTATMK